MYVYVLCFIYFMKNDPVTVLLGVFAFLVGKNLKYKNLFCIAYFIVRLCTFMTNFEVIGQKMTELWSFLSIKYFLNLFG